MLDKFHFLKSRKFWAVVAAFLTLLGASLQMDPFPTEDFTTKVVALILGYISTVAFEDGMRDKGQGRPNE